MRTALLLLLAAAACGDDRPAHRDLPGTIWFVDDAPAPTLVRDVDGARTVIGRDLYPSAYALPDGRLVAVASRGDGSAEGEQLALIDGAGHVTRVGPAAAQVRDPAVDPRGRWIVVAANLDGHSDLYRVDLGGDTTRITNDEQGNFRPAVLGDSIVYVSSRDGDAEIYRDGQRLTAFYRDDWEPTPSPDGSTIAFLSDRDSIGHVYLMNADGSNLRRLTSNTGEESEPTWSPDRAHLAYVVDGAVWLHDLASGAERKLTPEGERELEPSFSPDGAWLATSRVRGTESEIWVTNLETGESFALAPHARLPRWLP